MQPFCQLVQLVGLLRAERFSGGSGEPGGGAFWCAFFVLFLFSPLVYAMSEKSQTVAADAGTAAGVSPACSPLFCLIKVVCAWCTEAAASS